MRSIIRSAIIILIILAITLTKRHGEDNCNVYFVRWLLVFAGIYLVEMIKQFIILIILFRATSL